MLEKIKKNWQEFKEAEPGRRFQERYEDRQRKSQGKFNFGKLFNIVAGLVVAAAGVIFIPAPGPGSLILFLGLGLIGSEFQPLARALDWAEIRARVVADWGQGIWARMSLPVKIVIGLFLLVCAAGVAYGGYQLFFGGSTNTSS